MTFKPLGDEVQDFLDHIEGMRSCGCYDWADETLKGIWDSVSEFGSFTEAQEQAISNIENSHICDDRCGW